MCSNKDWGSRVRVRRSTYYVVCLVSACFAGCKYPVNVLKAPQGLNITMCDLYSQKHNISLARVAYCEDEE